MFNLISQRSLTAAALTVVMCFTLAACGGDDESEGKTVANTPTGDQTKLPDPPSVVAQRDTSKDKGNDVLDWLKMSPEKSDKAADKKPPPEPAKPEPKIAEVVAKPTPTAPPVQVASAVSQPVLQPVSASAREAAVSLPSPTSSAPVQVASAAPLASPAAVPAPATALKLISREQPGFPREAIRKGVTTGHVKARISVGADGSVKNVEVLESSPPRVFDNAVITAALRWKYAPMAEPASTVTEFDFKGDE